jgi:hypothetical protein
LHGLRYLPPCAIERINRLETGEKLWLAPGGVTTPPKPRAGEELTRLW